MSNKLFRGLVLFLFFISHAHAGFLIEPMVGFATGNFTAEGTGTGSGMAGSVDVDLKGINYGGRAGFTFGNFQLLGEYIHNDLKSSDEGMLDSFKVNEMAGLLGYRFGFFRLYGGHIFNADIEDSTESGKGFKAGLSFYALRHVALNLEYRMIKLNDTQDTDVEYKTFAILVSFPFGF